MNPTYDESRISLLAPSIDEKWAVEQDDLVNSSDVPVRPHCCCRSQRRNAFMKARIIALIVLLITFASCMAAATFCPGDHSLVKRQQSGNYQGNNNGSAFTSKHLWIIIVCVVGVILCLILAVWISACCCEHAFRNPLCCPCYACACLGCLGLLECIGCGLCGAGISQL